MSMVQQFYFDIFMIVRRLDIREDIKFLLVLVVMIVLWVFEMVECDIRGKMCVKNVKINL